MGIKDFFNKTFNFGSDDEPENTPTSDEVIQRWADEPQDPPKEKGDKDGA